MAFRISKVYPLKDGIGKMTQIKTKLGYYTRPVTKLWIPPCLEDVITAANTQLAITYSLCFFIVLSLCMLYMYF